MTLRITAELIPYGYEGGKFKIGHIDISNIGQVDDKGFGHVICDYSVKEFKPIPPILQKDEEFDELVKTKDVREHDRRDGTWALISKALQSLGYNDD